MAKSWEPTKEVVLPSGKPVLSAYIGRIIEALSELIIPPEGELPIPVNATQSYQALARYLRDLEPGARAGLKALLIIFDLLPFLFIFRFSRFVNLSPVEQMVYLLNWETSRFYYRRMVVVLFKTLVGMGYYNDPKVLEAIGFKLKCPEKRKKENSAGN